MTELKSEVIRLLEDELHCARLALKEAYASVPAWAIQQREQLEKAETVLKSFLADGCRDYERYNDDGTVSLPYFAVIKAYFADKELQQ